MKKTITFIVLLFHLFFVSCKECKEDVSVYLQLSRQQFVILLILIVLLFIVQLFMYYIRIRQKNRKIIEQQLDIKQKVKNIELLAQNIREQQRGLLLSSSIAKKVQKLSKEVDPNRQKSPLTVKDWNSIIEKVDAIYPSVRIRLMNANVTDGELYYCYLSFFCLDTKGEAILLHIDPLSVNKQRQRIRHKLGIIGKNTDIRTFLTDKL